MKLNAARLGFAVAGIIVVIAGIVIALGRHSKPNAVPAAPPAAHSQTIKRPQPTTTVAVSKHGKHNPPTQQRPIHPESETAKAAAKAAESFVEAYYLILPKDTAASRRRRVALFVPVRNLDQLDLSLGGGTAANRARIRERLTQKGRADLSGVIVKPVSDQKHTVAAAVPVIISVTRPNGKTVNSFTLQTVSRWSYQHGQWLLESFDEGGDTG